MDAGAFGLSRNPFQRIPELDEACLPNTFASLLSELQSALRSPQGVSVLVGEAGSGKTMAAAAFARRLANVAQTALLLHPTSSVTAIARDAMVLFGANADDADHGEDWVEALMASTIRRARGGKPTVIIVDEAHRLSPQTLEDLAELFDEEQPASLHLFLFGRPKLLDLMHAGPEKALHAHLLQVGRLEPLGLRECVRYLERRVALCGGELGALFHEGAIDELVRVSCGRLVHLEQNALAALERVSRKGASRVMAEDVRPMARPLAEEDDMAKTARQQALQFEMPDKDEEDDAGWHAGDDSGDADDWGHPLEDTDDEWRSPDDEEDEEQDLSWDASSPQFDDVDDADDEDGEEPDAFEPRASRAAAAAPRSGLAGRIALSVAACAGLVWAANHLPGPAADNSHGRDAKLFAEKLSSKPSEILRVAQSPEDADASAQVEAWKAQPPKPAAPVAQAVASAPKAPASAPAVGTTTAAADQPSKPSPAQARPSVSPAAPSWTTETVSAPKSAPTQVAAMPRAGGAAPTAKSPGKQPPAVTKASSRTSTKSAPVFTVQLGAFKARSNAEQLTTKLRGKPSRIVREGDFYRVYSGSFPSKREAAVHEASLKRQGFSAFVTTAVF